MSRYEIRSEDVGKGLDPTTLAPAMYHKLIEFDFNDLKNKVASSGPVQGFDKLYDQAAAKLKQATGGDAGAMQYVQKYRDFAQAHPVIQGGIYATLIALAGLSGAGVAGAGAIGLLKMADKLLQGERASSAAYSGAKAGAMAGAAGAGAPIRFRHRFGRPVRAAGVRHCG